MQLADKLPVSELRSVAAKLLAMANAKESPSPIDPTAEAAVVTALAAETDEWIEAERAAAPPVAEADELAQLPSRAPHFGREVAVLGAVPVLHALQRAIRGLAPRYVRVDPRGMACLVAHMRRVLLLDLEEDEEADDEDDEEGDGGSDGLDEDDDDDDDDMAMDDDE